MTSSGSDATSDTEITRRPGWLAPVLTYTISVVVTSGLTLFTFSTFAATHHLAVTGSDLVHRGLFAGVEARSGGLTHFYTINLGEVGIYGFPGYQYLSIAVARVALWLGMAPPVVNNVGRGINSPIHPQGNVWILFVAAWALTTFLALFPLDRLLRRCTTSGSRRLTALVVFACALAWMAFRWGHPEYCAAIAFIAWATLRGLRRDWGAVGWLLGFALACQFSTFLLFPLFLLLAGRRCLGLVLRSAVPVVGSVLIPLLGAPSATLHALANQEVFNLAGDFQYLTPWLAIERYRLFYNHRAHQWYLADVHVSLPRLVLLMPMVVLGWILARAIQRHRFEPRLFTWSVGVLLALRPLFEVASLPYYLGSGFVFLVLVGLCARRQSWAVMAVVFAALVCLTSEALLSHLSYLSAGHWESWLFYACIWIGTAAVVAATWPAVAERRREASEPELSARALTASTPSSLVAS